MRALILILSTVIVALAAAIVWHVNQRPEFVNRVGRLFYVGKLLADAQVDSLKIDTSHLVASDPVFGEQREASFANLLDTIQREAE